MSQEEDIRKEASRKYKFIIFDLADVLAQIWQVRSIAFLATGKQLGWGDRDIKQLQEVWGQPLVDMVKVLWPDQNPAVFEQAYLKNKDNFPVTEVEGAGAVVRKLISLGYQVGIITSVNRQMLRANLEQIGMVDVPFIYSQTSEDTSFHKPDGRVFDPVLLNSAQLGIVNEQLLYIGDDINDWLACREARIPFCAVLTGRSTKDQFLQAGVKPDRILNSVIDLPVWLEGQNHV